MGLAPAEIDVFSRPHSRIKRLVDNYSQKMSATDFSNYSSLKGFLGSLRQTFKEFKTHENIENECIMEKLKNRLSYHKVTVSEVAEVHSDDCLGKMKRMVDDGWMKTDNCSRDEMALIGNQLAEALTKFTANFLPHMKEEEEIFQPLLMKYFTYDELREIRVNVLRQHSLFMAPDDSWEEKTDQEVECQDKLEEDLVPAPIQLLPSEVALKIFSYLGPKDLCQCQQTCFQWSTLARDPSLWRTIYPVKWAQGDWRFDIPPEELEAADEDDISPSSYKIDEDADIDESESSGDSDASDSSQQSFRQIRKESKMVLGIVKHLLPAVGRGVEVLHLGGSKGVTSGMVYKMLQHTPNLKHLDLSSTMVSDVAFKGLSRHSSCSKLEHLDLSGCANVTDLTLQRLADAFRHRRNSYDEGDKRSYVKVDKNGKHKRGITLSSSSSQEPQKTCPNCGNIMCSDKTIAEQEPTSAQGSSINREGDKLNTRTLKYLSLSGCYRVTDSGLRALLEAGPYPHLSHLDLSGCLNVTAKGLRDLVKVCDSLDHQEFFYCDNILEGPYAQTASGCQNLECSNRVCCRSGE